MSRTGRRPGTPETRDLILAAARRRFATKGYVATSLRAIASEAKVDPALLIHYFGTKEALFIAAVGLPAPLPELFADIVSLPNKQAAETLVRRYLRIVDSERSRNTVLALVRSAVSSDKAASLLRAFLSDALLDVIEQRPGRGDPRLRASLIAAQLIGIAMLRHVLRLPPLAKASPDEVVELVAPAIERYLG